MCIQYGTLSNGSEDIIERLYMKTLDRYEMTVIILLLAFLFCL